MQEDNTLVLVDGSSLAFRSFFALFTSGLRSKKGIPTWAILGFFNSLFELIERYKPQMLAVAFDLAEPTFRHVEFKDYKANRLEMPDDLSVQWPLIKEGVRILGLPVYELAGYEADDIIGTVARAAEKRDLNVLILTGDQDAFQLIDGHNQKIKVLMPGKGGLQLYGRQEVFDKLGIWPEQVADYKGLCGDTSDNIPGIRGIGPKTAQQLLASYGDINGIYEHLNEIKAKGLLAKLTEGEAVARQSKDLATIREDIPLEFDFSHCHLTPPDIVAVSEFFSELEFKTLTNRLPKILKNFSMGQDADQLVANDNVVIEEIEPSVDLPVAEAKKEIRSLRIINSESELDDLLETLIKQSTVSLYIQSFLGVSPFAARVGLDVEPSILGYAFAWHGTTKESAYIPIRQTGLALGGQLGLDRRVVNEKLSKLFIEATVAKVVHNAKYVFNLLAYENLELENVVFDSMLASYICSPDDKHGLHDQARRLLGHSTERGQKNKPKASTKKESALALAMSTPIVNLQAEEASEDAEIILDLADYYDRIMDAEQKSLLQQMELPLSMVLAKIEQTGVSLDLPYLDLFSKELAAEINRLEQEIFVLAGHTFNINSTQQLQKILFEELGLVAKVKTKTGFSTDASVLESLRSEHEIIPSLLDYRQLTKLKSTYVDALPKIVSDIDKRLHCEFNQTTTSTGRLSSSNPNLQNIPIRTELGRRMRRAFVPADKNWFLVSADYSQIELRILAHMSQDERLIDAFQKGQDIHARTAGEIFDQPIEAVTSDMRRIGKTLNFALIYQQGAYSTARDLGVSTKQAASFIDKYFKRYASVKTFMEATIAKARQFSYVETLWNRKRYFKSLDDRNDALRKAEERAACNAPLQGSAADLMKLAMIRLDKELTAAKLQSKLILQVHDELVLEVPEAELEQVKEIVVNAMLMEQPLSVPLKVDVGMANNWMDAK